MRRTTALLIGVAALGMQPLQPMAVPAALCGNMIVEADEECDDGGTCIGSANAGTHCSAAAQCPGGRCVPFGGDGCAANCTAESDVRFDLVGGVAHGSILDEGGSGLVVRNDPLVIPLPLKGTEVLTVGKPRAGQVPLVVKAASVQFPAIRIQTIACACVRGVAGKTCGGTLFEPDGVTPSPDCTGDEGVCDGRNPCTYVHGAGNSASGVIGCDHLEGANFTFAPGCDGGTPTITFSGIGGPGSAVLFTTTAIGTLIGPCTTAPEFCTSADPQSVRGTAFTAPFVTATASALSCTAGACQPVGCCQAGSICIPELPPCDYCLGEGCPAFPRSILGCQATGAPFSCDALAAGSAAGACLATAYTLRTATEPTDSVVTGLLCAQPPITPGAATPTPMPTATPGPCVGDCNHAGTVTVDEVLRLVDAALRSAPAADCNCQDSPVTIACIVGAVNAALNGCSAPPAVCGGIAGLPCAANEICDFRDMCAVADAAGVCVQRPDACPALFNPVCGCDGITYPSDCERLRAGAARAHSGAC